MDEMIDIEELCRPADEAMARVDLERALQAAALEAAQDDELRERNRRSAEVSYLKWFGFNSGAA